MEQPHSPNKSTGVWSSQRSHQPPSDWSPPQSYQFPSFHPSGTVSQHGGPIAKPNRSSLTTPRSFASGTPPRKRLVIGFILTAVVVVSLSVGLGTFLTLRSSGGSTSATTEVQIISRNTTMTYTDGMADRDSDDFLNVESTHCKEIEEILGGSNCSVLLLRNGSVIIESVLKVKNASGTLGNLLQNIIKRLRTNGIFVRHVDRAVGACGSSPCANNGSCRTNRGRSFCDCPESFEGIRCEVATNRSTSPVTITTTSPTANTTTPLTTTTTTSPNTTTTTSPTTTTTSPTTTTSTLPTTTTTTSPTTTTTTSPTTITTTPPTTTTTTSPTTTATTSPTTITTTSPTTTTTTSRTTTTTTSPTTTTTSSPSATTVMTGITSDCRENQFSCTNGKCVPLYFRCDGYNDCDDLSDEQNCGVCPSDYVRCDGIPECKDWSDEIGCDCSGDQFQCNDTAVCLHRDFWCAGYSICPDGSDVPEGCACKDYQFHCSSGPIQCISASEVCDGYPGCADKSDELNCNCSHDERRCKNTFCVDEDRWCDGIDDCGDLSDEIGCTCSSDQLQCDDGLTCFSKGQWCDGYPNCQDGSDEKDNCTCLDGEQFACDGFCLPLAKRCNGVKDCIGAEDENPSLCGECHGFKCNRSLECISRWDRCDGTPDCDDRSDEEGCAGSGGCSDGEFTCDNGRCLNNIHVCDQYDSCGDNSDERGCQYDCLKEEFQCNNGSCIPKTWLCDLIPDCKSAEDENITNCVNCNKGQNPCRGGNTCFSPSETCDGLEQCPYGEDEHRCVYLDKESAEDGEASVVKVTKKNVAYDGICSENWSKAWTSKVCKYLGYGEGEKATFTAAPPGASLLNPTSADPTTRPLLDNLTPGLCNSGQLVSVKCISKECGIVPLHPNAFSPYIIHGEDAAVGAWPWQIQLFHSGRFHCGGSIIDRKWILTAAHCVWDWIEPMSPHEFSLRVGTTQLGVPDPNSRMYRVDRIILHPAYNSHSTDSDIALVRVTQPIEYSPYVKPVCVADASYNVSSAVECFTSGWGSHNVYLNTPARLKQAKMDILSHQYCRQLAWAELRISPQRLREETQLCVGFPPKPISGCSGDSGGPLVCRDEHFHWTLAGVTSWGPARCDSFSIYVRVSTFSEWIAMQMAQTPAL